DGIRDDLVTGVQTCALPIWMRTARRVSTNENPSSPREVRRREVLPTIAPMTLQELDAARPDVRHQSVAGSAVVGDQHLEPVGAPVGVERDLAGARRNGN